MMKKIRLSTEKINDWPSFHQVFAETMGFPTGYGRNLDAWVECMANLDGTDGNSSQDVVECDDLLVVEIPDVDDFKVRCPDQFLALLNRTAEVNARYTDAGREAAVALVFA